MATKVIAQRLFPPSTVISLYTPSQVDNERQTTRAPANQTPIAGVSAGVSAVAASVVTGVVGDDNAIEWTAQDTGTDGNDITVALVNDGNSQTLDVDASGTVISVSLETDSGGVVLSTATEVQAAVAAHAVADSLVAVDDSSTSDGTGVVEEVAETPLTGGIDTLGTDQALIAADGTMTVTGVTTNSEYYAVGSVNGEYRYLRFQA